MAMMPARRAGPGELPGDPSLRRRRLLQGLAAACGLGVAGCRAPPPQTGESPVPLAEAERARFLAPLLARTDLISHITVCLRPFRAAGPRLDTEWIGDALVVHNYGHGGSGWSLSWGSSAIAVGKALAHSPDRIAVIGCGVMGITSALLAQRAGKAVTIYSKEPIAQSFSARASGSFTPDSRIALANAARPEFPAQWETMARTSLETFRGYLGQPGDPVHWVDRYVVYDSTAPAVPARATGELEFAAYGSRLRDVMPQTEALRPEDTPFAADAVVRRRRVLTFNIATYTQLLMTEFEAAGGRVVTREFLNPAEFGRLPEKAVVNCTGYGARALWSDESVVPVRGQLAYLSPQRGFDYALAYRDVNVVPRSDGIVVQSVVSGDMHGYGDASLAVDRPEADTAMLTLAELYRTFRPRMRF